MVEAAGRPPAQDGGRGFRRHRARCEVHVRILAMAPVVWQLGRVSRGSAARTGPPAVGATSATSATRLFLITVSIVTVSLICLAVAIFGKAVPGALR